MKTPDTRHTCQFCKAKTWSTDYTGFMRDHDRPEGGRCLRAAKVYSADVWKPNWAPVSR